MKRLILLLTLVALSRPAFSATTANEYYLTKRNAANTANQQKTVVPTSGQVLKFDSSLNPVGLTLATVATTGSYNDLTNKPAPASSAWADITGKPSFATVATSGSYNDLSNKPSGTGANRWGDINGGTFLNSAAETTMWTVPAAAFSGAWNRTIIMYGILTTKSSSPGTLTIRVKDVSGTLVTLTLTLPASLGSAFVLRIFRTNNRIGAVFVCPNSSGGVFAAGTPDWVATFHGSEDVTITGQFSLADVSNSMRSDSVEGVY